MRSIQREVLRTLALGLGGLLVALNAAVWWMGARSLAQSFDARLDERVRVLATLVVQRGPYVELEFAEDLMPVYSRKEAPDYFQAWILGPGGGVLERSDSLGDSDLPRPADDAASTRFALLALPDGRAGRCATYRALIHEYAPAAADGKTATQRTAGFAVATGLEPLHSARRQLLAWLLSADALFVLGSVVVVAATLRRGLAPIHAFSRTLSAVTDPRRAPDLGALAAPAELRSIATGVEAMLARLGAAFERERRLSSNVAHELRTPVAELRLSAEVALGRPDSRDGLERAVRDARDIALEMERTITTLLRVWRDEQAREHAIGAADLAAVLAVSLRGIEATCATRGLEVVRGAVEVRDVAVSERPLALVIANLLQNAATHSRNGSCIKVEVTETTADVTLSFSNEVSHEFDVARVFEPFYSTGSSAEHAGLGLPLCRALCEASGMDLDVAHSGERFVARLRVPRPASGPSEA